MQHSLSAPSGPRLRGWRLLSGVLLAFMASAVASCGQLNLDNGKLWCSGDGRCPEGYYCATDDHCWLTGTGPDGSAGYDAGGSNDLDGGNTGDAGNGDGGARDGGNGLDGGQTPPPPSNIWLSSGGGSGAVNGRQLGLSFGGSPIFGAGTGTASSLVFGNLCAGSEQ